MTLTAEKTAKEVLEHLTGITTFTFKAKCYLMLMTATPATSGTEGVTMAKCKAVECTVTKYKRFLIENAAGNKVAFSESAGKGIFENSEEWEVQTALEGAGQKITFWAVVQELSGETGKVIFWGSCTSTEISGTQTPVKVAAKALKAELA